MSLIVADTPPAVHSAPDPADVWAFAHAARSEGFDFDAAEPVAPEFEPDWDLMAELAVAQDRLDAGLAF